MPLQIPHPETARHLYRHILREATYLPPLVRPWSFEYIKTRFRGGQDAQDPKKHIKEAHRQLRFLRAANAGDVRRMLRICLLATGRLGKRRRQLADEYLSKSPPADSAMLENTSCNSNDAMRRLTLAAWGQSVDGKAGTKEKKKGEEPLPSVLDSTWLGHWDLEKVRILGESQYNRQESVADWITGNKIRRTINPKTTVVTENCWGLTLRPKQMTRKLQKHWKSVIASLMPPLPQGEWDTLKDLAEGVAPENTWRIPPRRPVATPVESDMTKPVIANATALWDWENYVTMPIRKLERKNSRRMKALSGSSDEHPYRQGPPIGVRAFKARSLTRGIYAKVLLASPVMKKNANGNWKVTWGGENKHPTLSKPTSTDSQFFQGVDAMGKILAREVDE
ncbi:hypothetical protein SCUP234_04257 [Seiridium cupressi]